LEVLVNFGHGLYLYGPPLELSGGLFVLDSVGGEWFFIWLDRLYNGLVLCGGFLVFGRKTGRFGR
jgi:predicted small integral membrane protein